MPSKHAAVTVRTLQARKDAGQKIVVLTAYDYPTAVLMEEAGVDAVLVGDSLGMAVMGLPSTLPVTMEDMLHHTKMVRRGLQHPLLIADLPFLSYQITPEEALRNAGRLMAEGGAEAVKLEGGPELVGPTVSRIAAAGIPVMGHLGLTPQSVHQFGGYRVQGREPDAIERYVAMAKGLEEAGCFGIVLECLMPEVAAAVTEALRIPTIGIGAGDACDGQVLVTHDMLGWGETRFTKTFADVRGAMLQGFRDYSDAVRGGEFPGPEHTYGARKSAAAGSAGSDTAPAKKDTPDGGV